VCVGGVGEGGRPSSGIPLTATKPQLSVGTPSAGAKPLLPTPEGTPAAAAPAAAAAAAATRAAPNLSKAATAADPPPLLLWGEGPAGPLRPASSASCINAPSTEGSTRSYSMLPYAAAHTSKPDPTLPCPPADSAGGKWYEGERVGGGRRLSSGLARAPLPISTRTCPSPTLLLTILHAALKDAPMPPLTCAQRKPLSRPSPARGRAPPELWRAPEHAPPRVPAQAAAAHLQQPERH
jgi:hypothetical protein